MTNKKGQQQKARLDSNHPQNGKLNRRTILKAMAGIPVLGAFAYGAVKDWAYDREKREKRRRAIKELGVDDVQAPQTISAGPGSKGERLRVGIIGFGDRANQLANGLGFMHPDDAKTRQGRGRLGDWTAQEDLNVELAGICEVFDLRAERGMKIAKEGFRVNGESGTDYPVKRYRTYQEMLEDKDIDAVIIATPEHQHARMTIDAVQAGKHVYCEKSFTRTEEELYAACDAVKNSNVVFQLGHQQTQNVIYRQAKEILDRNILGEITLIETTTNRNYPGGAWIRHLDANGNPKPGDEKSIDWKQWLGPRPYVPFSIDRYYNWTKFFDYSTGMLGQLFTHEFDAINQLLHIGIPKSVVSSGGIYYWKDNRDIPDVLHSVFEYPDKGLALLYSATLASNCYRPRMIMGHDARMELGGSLKVTIDYDSTRYKKQIEEGLIGTSEPVITARPGSGSIDAVTSATEKYYAERGLTSTYVNGRHIDVTHLHIKEWIDCIRNGGTPRGSIDKAFEEGITVMMAHKSYLEKRRVEWDPIQQKIV
jgi:predicted dehydrogenase